MIDFLIWAAIFQGLFLALIYFTSREHRSFSNMILGFYLLALIQEALNLFLPYEKIGTYMLNSYFSSPESKLFLPVLFFHYVLLKIDRVSKYILIIRLMYYVAFCVALLTLVNVFLFFLSGQTLQNLWNEKILEKIFLSQQTLACISSFVILAMSVKEVLAFQKDAKNKFSDIDLLQVHWLWQLIISMSIATLLWGVEVTRVLAGGFGTSNIAMAAWGIIFIFLFYTSYKAFIHKDLFTAASDHDLNKESKPLSSAFDHDTDPEEFAETLSKLDSLMEKDQLFLNSNLTIYEVANITGISGRKISQCINTHHNKNFSEWVNSYRIDKAIPLLQNISQNNYTIESIGFDCGFNSRSAMYLAFKKIKGKSPGDYKL